MAEYYNEFEDDEEKDEENEDRPVTLLELNTKIDQQFYEIKKAMLHRRKIKNTDPELLDQEQLAHLKIQFLEELAHSAGNVQRACEMVRVAPMTMHRLKNDDSVFKDEWEIALTCGADMLESEAIRRGHDGMDKAQYYRGRIVGYEKVYSDSLLLKLLTGRKQKVFGDAKRLTLEGGDKPIKTEGKMTTSIRSKMDEILSDDEI